MQNRMKNHPLSNEQITDLLNRAQVGNLATIGKDGYPYVLPVHFVYCESKIYIHGLPKGMKIDNIKTNEKVGFEAYDMKGLIKGDSACNTNTEYESVVITGTAKIIDDSSVKEKMLDKIVDKYTPKYTGQKLPENMIKGTAVLEVDIKDISGKYYR